jgi:hypothetical protein
VVKGMHQILDVVELRSGAGRWPAGTTGTVVEATADGVLIEISDGLGRGLDFVTLPHSAAAPRVSRSLDRAAS